MLKYPATPLGISTLAWKTNGRFPQQLGNRPTDNDAGFHSSHRVRSLGDLTGNNGRTTEDRYGPLRRLDRCVGGGSQVVLVWVCGHGMAVRA
jgi:hypothetical protein